MLCETTVAVITSRSYLPAALRALARDQPWSRILRKVGDDIWTTHEPVPPHTDGTADGLVTFGLVIVNDPEVMLVHGGHEYFIPVGSLYRIDGRIEHSTRGACGLFAALIWDMPMPWSLADFALELAQDERFAG